MTEKINRRRFLKSVGVLAAMPVVAKIEMISVFLPPAKPEVEIIKPVPNEFCLFTESVLKQISSSLQVPYDKLAKDFDCDG